MQQVGVFGCVVVQLGDELIEVVVVFEVLCQYDEFEVWFVGIVVDEEFVVDQQFGQWWFGFGVMDFLVGVVYLLFLCIGLYDVGQ